MYKEWIYLHTKQLMLFSDKEFSLFSPHICFQASVDARLASEGSCSLDSQRISEQEPQARFPQRLCTLGTVAAAGL